jgi:hypothetical protein
MTFTITRLVGNRAMVRGTDVHGSAGETVVDTTQWDDINGHGEYDQAQSAFDAAVQEFFAPLTEAAEKLAKAVNTPQDSLGYVVLQEGTDPVQGEERVLVKLTPDSMILRAIETGETDRLVWVGDNLEVAEYVTVNEEVIDENAAAAANKFIAQSE